MRKCMHLCRSHLGFPRVFATDVIDEVKYILIQNVNEYIWPGPTQVTHCLNF